VGTGSNRFQLARKDLAEYDHILATLREGKNLEGQDKPRIQSAVAHLTWVSDRIHNEFDGLEQRTDEAQPMSGEQLEEFSSLTDRCSIFGTDVASLQLTISLRSKRQPGPTNDFWDPLGVCNAADRLIEHLFRSAGQSRTSYVLLTTAAQFNPSSLAIHLDKTQLKIWGLNRAVHEFGHLWGEEYASGPNGAQTKFLSSVAKVWPNRLAKEFFADIVATISLGLAYACSSLYLDFRPSDRISNETHPSDDERAHCILMVLRLLREGFDETTKQRFITITERISKDWDQDRSGAGARAPIRNKEILQNATEEIFRMLVHERPGLRYRDLSPACCVYLALDRETAAVPCRIGAVDILNGAWLKRLGRQHEPPVSLNTIDTIERKALEMLHGALKDMHD
jgi:hypothetical protein